MKVDNPFTLNFGRKPGKYIIRYEDVNNILTAFESESMISQTYLISGIRGSGKTVLMTAISKELAERYNWICVDLNPSFDLLEDLCNRLLDECKRVHGLEDSSFSFSISGFGIGISSKSRDRDSVSKIDEIMKYLVKKGKKVLITVDEVINNDNIRRFVSQFQIFIRKEYPLYMIMTGLYDSIYSIQNDKSITFLLRSPKIFLGPLSMHQIVIQYRDVFNIDIEFAKKLAAQTKGYAFAFQALGFLYWNHRQESSFNEILEKLDSVLDDFVYKKIWEGLSEQDRKIVRALNDEESCKVSTLRENLGMTSQSFSKYRERLINKGVVCSNMHGYLSLALPRFSEIIKTYI